MKRPIAIALCILLISSLAGCRSVYEDSRVVFDSDISVGVRLYGRNAQAAAEEMFALFDDLAVCADATNPDSEIGLFNAAAVGETVAVGETCYTLLRKAETLFRETFGAFNVALLPLSKLWYVDAESIHRYTPLFGQEPYPSPETLPDYDSVQSALKTATPDSWTLTETDGGYTLTKNAPVEIDLGAVAKGWAADRCAEIARKFGLSARIDVSGNLYLVGKYFNDRKGRDEDWYVGVTDPRPRPAFVRDYVTVLHHAGDTSIVTSGDYERYYFYQNGLAVPHIIGRDGLPVGVAYDGERYVNTGAHIISATVVGESSLLCDAYATAVSVMGIDEGMRFLSKTGYSALLFTDDGRFARSGVELAYTEAYTGYKAYTEIEWTA